jgi:hypothetical protein
MRVFSSKASKSSSFAEFINKAPSKQKKRVYRNVLEKASSRQNDIVRLWNEEKTAQEKDSGREIDRIGPTVRGGSGSIRNNQALKTKVNRVNKGRPD